VQVDLQRDADHLGPEPGAASPAQGCLIDAVCAPPQRCPGKTQRRPRTHAFIINGKIIIQPAMDKNAYFWRVMEGKLPPPGAAATLNIRFTHIDADAGTIETTFEAGAGFTNPAGHVQGGFLAAMLDDTMGPALAATLAEGEIAPTLNLNVSFERPAQVGTLHGKGRVLKRGRDVCFLAGELYQDGQRVASATATALVRKIAT
jgi:uncharacterized protein (TIGR00369 family)